MVDPELIKYLRLHAQTADFTQIVQIARKYQEIQEATRPKKTSMKLATVHEYESTSHENQTNWQPVLDKMEQMLQILSNKENNQDRIGCASARSSSNDTSSSNSRRNRRKSSSRQSSQQDQSSADEGQDSDNQQRRVRFPDESPNRQDSTNGNQRQYDDSSSSPGNGSDNRDREQGGSQTSSRGRNWERRRDSRDRSPGDDKRQQSSESRSNRADQRQPQWNSRRNENRQNQGENHQNNNCEEMPHRGWSSGQQSSARENRESDRWQNGPPGAQQLSRPQTESEQSFSGQQSSRRPQGCYVCGTIGCHTAFHAQQGSESRSDSPISTALSHPHSDTGRQSLNDQRSSRLGERTPPSTNSPQ